MSGGRFTYATIPMQTMDGNISAISTMSMKMAGMSTSWQSENSACTLASQSGQCETVVTIRSECLGRERVKYVGYPKILVVHFLRRSGSWPAGLRVDHDPGTGIQSSRLQQF